MPAPAAAGAAFLRLRENITAATTKPIATKSKTMPRMGRAAIQASATTIRDNGEAIASEMTKTPAPKSEPKKGMMSAMTTSGRKNNPMPMTISSQPTKRRIHVRVLFASSAALNMLLALCLPRLSICSESPALVW